jgi:energy-coupling factor transporter ATP-binding protein EcfA2
LFQVGSRSAPIETPSSGVLADKLTDLLLFSLWSRFGAGLRFSGVDQRAGLKCCGTPLVGYMKDFLFRPEQARTPVGVLSGGERARLTFARALARPSNLLVLDEPTNDLDLEALDLLQELQADYSGTVLLVSHDRDFLDRVVTSVIATDGNGRWIEYAGGYTDMLSQRAVDWPRNSAGAGLRRKAPAASAGGQSATVAKPRRMSANDRVELEPLPARIAAWPMVSARTRMIMGLSAMVATMSQDCIEPVGSLSIAWRPLGVGRIAGRSILRPRHPAPMSRRPAQQCSGNLLWRLGSSKPPRASVPWRAQRLFPSEHQRPRNHSACLPQSWLPSPGRSTSIVASPLIDSNHNPLDLIEANLIVGDHRAPAGAITYSAAT